MIALRDEPSDFPAFGKTKSSDVLPVLCKTMSHQRRVNAHTRISEIKYRNIFTDLTEVESVNVERRSLAFQSRGSEWEMRILSDSTAFGILEVYCDAKKRDFNSQNPQPAKP